MSEDEILKNEASAIAAVIRSYFSRTVYGKDAIIEMKKSGMNWRQMEWPGWYFEETGVRYLQSEIGGSRGPRYGNTTFDYQNEFVWDLKLHSKDSGSILVLNDWESVRSVISDRNGVGFVIGMAEMEYDEDGEFKIWHDELKGGASDFERDRMERGAPSRKRKTSFTLAELIILFFNDFSFIEKGGREGWITEFQRNMRNADGSRRRPKIAINLDLIPREIVIGRW